MTPLPEMHHVIDYAHHECNSELMDIFLAASCKFCIGTASGYFRIPRYFGIPVLFTNCTSTLPYFSLKEDDLFLPRLLRHKSSNRYLSFEEIMSPPIATFIFPQSFVDADLYWDENTSDELKAATFEMLEKINKLPLKIMDSNLQRNFKEVAKTSGQKFDGYPVKAFASISKNFIEKHVALLSETEESW
jgi:putative glycosyltransferase (TIGR04372 family)